MSFKTVSGLTYAGVGASGVKEWASGDTMEAADLNGAHQDLQGAAMDEQLAGVLTGGVCTASTLTITIPSGTVYFARQLWAADAAVTGAVPDDATTYLWGCADGVVRLTATTTPPDGWSTRTACILTKAVAAGGTATVDNTVQQRSRYADPAARTVTEAGLLVAAGGLEIPYLAADPDPLVNGMIWIDSGTHDLRWVSGGSVRAAPAGTPTPPP